MGKNIALIVLLLLMLGGAICQNIYISSTTATLTESLEQIMTALEQGNIEKAAQIADEFNALWQKEKNTYEALFEHKEVDTISSAAGTIKTFCTANRIPDALSQADQVLFYIEHIHAIDCVGWENIF